MWCVTPKLLDDGTMNNSQVARCWSLMHCQTEVPSSQKPCQVQDHNQSASPIVSYPSCPHMGQMIMTMARRHDGIGRKAV